jgi:hypothetical protein
MAGGNWRDAFAVVFKFLSSIFFMTGWTEAGIRLCLYYLYANLDQTFRFLLAIWCQESGKEPRITVVEMVLVIPILYF